MQQSGKLSEQSVKRFDDIVRSEQYFTATLLPAMLLHDNLDGVQHFIKLIDSKSHVRRDKDGNKLEEKTPTFLVRDVEVITEFHIARDLRYEDLQRVPLIVGHSLNA